jgi:chromosome segregation ATPase
MSEKAKQSKFEKKAVVLLEDGENTDVLASRGYRKAVSKVNIQVAQLEGKKVELESKIDEAKDALESAQFDVEFNLNAYDTANSTLENLQEELTDVVETLVNRKDLLKSWK